MAHPTIDLSYSTSLTVDFEENTKRTKFGDGQSQRFNRGVNAPAQKWRLQYDEVTDAEAETLREYYVTRGAVTPVSWTPWNQSTELKFISLSFSSTPNGANNNNVTVGIEQVFDQ